MKNLNLNVFAEISDRGRAELIELLKPIHREVTINHSGIERVGGTISEEQEALGIALDQLLEALGAEGHEFT